jgi:CDP-diacylglycerol--serine O-phosphatidyltransferase
MKRGIYILPNALTICGMCLGFYSILATMKGNYIHASWAVMFAMVFDGLDGWVARLTHSSSKFGIELDSLSDLVAFGIAPSVLVYKWALLPFGRIGWLIAFLFAGFGAIRLARYNIQMGSTESKAFTGMPIPGAAAVIVTLVIFYSKIWDGTPVKNYFILFLTLILAILMVSTLKFHGLKELDLRKRKPLRILIAFVIVLSLIIAHPQIALFIFAMLYLIGGIIENIILYARKRGGKGKAGIQK